MSIVIGVLLYRENYSREIAELGGVYDKADRCINEVSEMEDCCIKSGLA
jgi:hypothetical protein